MMTNGNELAKRQTELALKAREGDARALRDLMESMQGYIVHMRHRFASEGLDRDDIEQACRVGILRALRTYDPARGGFPAAASAWIREEIRLLSDMMLRPVRLPQSRPLRAVQWHVMPRVRAMVAAGVPEGEALERACAEVGVSVDEAQKWLATKHSVEVGASDDGVQRHEPEYNPDPTEQIENEDRAYALSIVRRALDDDEWELLRRRVEDEVTYAAIAAERGVTQERIRQVMNSIYAKAREALLDEDLGPEALL